MLFSSVVLCQEVPAVNNSKNTLEAPEKKEMKVQSDDATIDVESAQLQLFSKSVQELQSELNTISHSFTRKSPTALELQKMQKQLDELKRINAQSFEYNLLNYQVGNYDFSRLKSLKDAEKLQANNAALLQEFSAYAYIVNDEDLLNNYLSKLERQQVYSKDLQKYAENTLQSLPKNTVLITHGDHDTYPLLIQQKIKKSRKDVDIISLDHLQSEVYRKRLKKSGLQLPKGGFIDTDYFKEFLRLNAAKNIVVAGSVPRAYLIKAGADMKTVGLGVSFQDVQIYDDAWNQNLYERSMRMSIEQHVKTVKNLQLLGNYLPFLFSVRNSYIVEGNSNKIEEVEGLILQIAKLSNKYQQVSALLNK